MGSVKSCQEDDDQGDANQAGSESYKEANASQELDPSDKMGGEIRMGDVQRGKKFSCPFDRVKLGPSCKDKLMPPSNPHIEKKEALEVVADFD